MAVLACFLCAKGLEQRTSKKGKPYFVCYACGTQFFVRGKPGIEKLAELISALSTVELSNRARAKTLLEISAILAEIGGTKNELKKLENKIGLFRADKEEVQARKLLKTRLRNLLAELARVCKQK